MKNDEEKFILFIESFEEFYKPISEISKDNEGDRILVNSDFPMYSLDEICDNCTLFYNEGKKNPKTSDALFSKIDKNGNLIIHFIEFKGDKFEVKKGKKAFRELLDLIYRRNEKLKKDKIINEKNKIKFEQIYDKYADDLEYGVRIKSFETIFEALPVIYEKYCEDENIIDEEKFDIFELLYNSEKYLWTVVYTCTAPNEVKDHIRRLSMPTVNRDLNVPNWNRDVKSMVPGSYEYRLEKHFFRLELANVFKKCFLVNPSYFNKFVNKYLNRTQN